MEYTNETAVQGSAVAALAPDAPLTEFLQAMLEDGVVRVAGFDPRTGEARFAAIADGR